MYNGLTGVVKEGTRETRLLGGDHVHLPLAGGYSLGDALQDTIRQDKTGQDRNRSNHERATVQYKTMVDHQPKEIPTEQDTREVKHGTTQCNTMQNTSIGFRKKRPFSSLIEQLFVKICRQNHCHAISSSSHHVQPNWRSTKRHGMAWLT